MSAAEKQLIENKITASGLSKTDFLVRALTKKRVINVSKGNEILAELKRQGNNLNQVIKNTYFGRTTERELLYVVNECKVLYRKISAILRGD